MKRIEDFPTDPNQISEEGVSFFEEKDDTAEANAVIILSQLNPLEMVDGEPRWSQDQQLLIGQAESLVAGWDN